MNIYISFKLKLFFLIFFSSLKKACICCPIGSFYNIYIQKIIFFENFFSQKQLCTINQHEVLVTTQASSTSSVSGVAFVNKSTTAYNSRRTSVESIPAGDCQRFSSSEFDGQVINHGTSLTVLDVNNQKLSKQNSLENSQSGGSVDSLTVNTSSSCQQPLVSNSSGGGLTQKSFQDLEKKLAALRNADSVEEVCIIYSFI